MKSALYLDKLPIRYLDLSSRNNDTTIDIIGFSGDSVRTCIYYKIKDNPLDYQVREAYLIDDKERIYCLVSVIRMGQARHSTWMEFGPIPPDTNELKLCIIRIQQAPTLQDFKVKGRSFPDPWDPEFPLSRELIDKMDSWLGDMGKYYNIDHSAWDCCGNWIYNMPMGTWCPQEVDLINPLSFELHLGKEIIRFREFRNSNTGALVVFEVRNEAMEKLGDAYKSRLLKILADSGTLEDFDRELAKIGLSRGFVPVDLRLRLCDKESGACFAPDFVDSRGVLHNRVYHFFDDCIHTQNCEIIIKDLLNLKIDPPLRYRIDVPTFNLEEKFEFDYKFGEIKVKGSIIFTDIIFSEAGVRIAYKANVSGDLEDLEFRDINIVWQHSDESEEEFPTLGGRTHREAVGGSHGKFVIFPAIHTLMNTLPEWITLEIKSVNVRLKDGIKFGFENRSASCCMKINDEGK